MNRYVYKTRVRVHVNEKFNIGVKCFRVVHVFANVCLDDSVLRCEHWRYVLHVSNESTIIYCYYV